MPAIELEFKEGSKVPIYIENLHRHDNELFEKQIRKLGDVQHRKSNVKADMTEWLLTKYENFRNLGVDIVVNHLPHLNRPPIDGSVFDWIFCFENIRCGFPFGSVDLMPNDSLCE